MIDVVVATRGELSGAEAKRFCASFVGAVYLKLEFTELVEMRFIEKPLCQKNHGAGAGLQSSFLRLWRGRRF